MRSVIRALCPCLIVLSCSAEELPAFVPAERDGLLVIEAENYDELTASRSKTWVLEGPTGYVGAGALRTDPDLGDRHDTDYVGYVPSLRYRVDFKEGGKYYVWLRGYAPNEDGRSVHVGLDGKAVEDASRMVIVSSGRYEWTNRRLRGEEAFIEVPSSGEHTLDVWMREDGFVVDRLLLTPQAAFTGAQGTSLGPPESVRGSGEQPCGNGEQDRGEQCDGEVCCTSVCSFEAIDTFCGDPAANTLCKTPPVCSGTSAACGASRDIPGCTCTAPNACTMVIEAEDSSRVRLRRYVVDPVNVGYVRLPEGGTDGTLTARFTGPSGTYKVEVVIGLESVPGATLLVSIGGAQVKAHVYGDGAPPIESDTIENIPPQVISYGDEIVLTGKVKTNSSGTAYARVDKIVIKSVP